MKLLNYEFSVWKSLYINWQKIIHTTWSMFRYRNMYQHGCGARDEIQSINSGLIIHEHNVNTRIDELYPSYSPVINSTTKCASVAFYLSLPFLFSMWTRQSFSIQVNTLLRTRKSSPLRRYLKCSFCCKKKNSLIINKSVPNSAKRLVVCSFETAHKKLP